MVITRNGVNTNANINNEMKQTPIASSRAMLNEVMEDLLVEAQERAKFAERALAEADGKCRMLEYELMLVRNEKVEIINKIENDSKNRRFYYLFWLSCSLLLQSAMVYRVLNL